MVYVGYVHDRFGNEKEGNRPPFLRLYVKYSYFASA